MDRNGGRRHGHLKILFRAVIKSTYSQRQRSETFVVSEQKAKQFCSPPPIPDLAKNRHQNDLDRIQTLPVVRVVKVIDGDTLIVSSSSTKYKIRLDSIDCPECGQDWGYIATRDLIKLVGGKSQCDLKPMAEL